jgi:hypothetical protein
MGGMNEWLEDHIEPYRAEIAALKARVAELEAEVVRLKAGPKAIRFEIGATHAFEWIDPEPTPSPPPDSSDPRRTAPDAASS